MIPCLAADLHAHPTWGDLGPWDWAAFAVCAMIAAWSIWKAVLYTLDPGEREGDHIKRRILEEPARLEVRLVAPGAGGLRGGPENGDG